MAKKKIPLRLGALETVQERTKVLVTDEIVEPLPFRLTVNPQITDSVTQVNTEVLGDAPAVATGNLFVSVSQALSGAAHNATTGQHQSVITSQAATVTGLDTLFSTDTASTGASTERIYGGVSG
jgi:hypothetical protein